MYSTYSELFCFAFRIFRGDQTFCASCDDLNHLSLQIGQIYSIFNCDWGKISGWIKLEKFEKKNLCLIIVFIDCFWFVNKVHGLILSSKAKLFRLCFKSDVSFIVAIDHLVSNKSEPWQAHFKHCVIATRKCKNGAK